MPKKLSPSTLRLLGTLALPLSLGLGEAVASPSSGSSTPVKLKVLSSVRPVYPPEALKTASEGDCHVRLQVDAEGNPTEAAPIFCAPVFLAAAEAAAIQWRFEPALDAAGQPISATVDVVLHFRVSPAPSEVQRTGRPPLDGYLSFSAGFSPGIGEMRLERQPANLSGIGVMSVYQRNRWVASVDLSKTIITNSVNSSPDAVRMLELQFSGGWNVLDRRVSIARADHNWTWGVVPQPMFGLAHAWRQGLSATMGHTGLVAGGVADLWIGGCKRRHMWRMGPRISWSTIPDEVRKNLDLSETGRWDLNANVGFGICGP